MHVGQCNLYNNWLTHTALKTKKQVTIEKPALHLTRYERAAMFKKHRCRNVANAGN